MKNNWQFHFWTMFSFPELERWLAQQEAQGRLLEDVRFSYFFRFRQGTAGRVAFHVDFARYMPRGYLGELERQGWHRQRLNRNWQLFSSVYLASPPPLTTSHDLDMARSLQRSSIISLILLAVLTAVFVFMIGERANEPVIRIAVIVMALMSLASIARISFYRIMLTERAGQKEDKY